MPRLQGDDILTAAKWKSKMLAPGEIAPEIVLSDSTGAPWRLSEQVLSGTVVLLFYRGHW